MLESLTTDTEWMQSEMICMQELRNDARVYCYCHHSFNKAEDVVQPSGKIKSLQFVYNSNLS